MASHSEITVSVLAKKRGTALASGSPHLLTQFNKNNMNKIKFLFLCMPFCIGMSYILNRDSLYSQSGTAQADDNG